MTERITELQLKTLESRDREIFSFLLFDIARKYSPYLGLNFNKDILPNLSDKDWWEADYGVNIVEGKEIGMSLKDAFRCLIDTRRTFQLSLGLSEEIRDLKKKNDKVIAIDAGTGTGILSILAIAHGVNEVYAIEINKQTFDATSDFIHKLGLNNKIHVIEGDATSLDLGALMKNKANLLISENLSGGLMDEPQYEIIKHLSNFLAPNGRIIPFKANLSISLSQGDWEKYQEKRKIAERRLSKSVRISSPVNLCSVESCFGMPIPLIQGEVKIPTNHNGPINTLLIHTNFQINEMGIPYFLEPDTAEFLGKTQAFKIDGEVYANKNGVVKVNLKYEAGRKGQFMRVEGSGNQINLTDPYFV